MNKVKILVLAIALLVMSLSLSAAPKGDGAVALKSKHNHLFVLKTNRKFVGATVEVVSSHGEVLTSQLLDKKKLIIDFKNVRQGAYTIRVVKGDRVEKFNYLNI